MGTMTTSYNTFKNNDIVGTTKKDIIDQQDDDDDVPRTTTTTLQMKSGVVRHNNTFVSATTFVGVVVLGMVGFMAYQNNNTTPSPMSMTTIPEISGGADSTTSVFRMADVVGAEEDEEDGAEDGAEEEEDEDEEEEDEDEEEDGVYGSYGGNRGSDGGVGYGKFGSKALGGGYGKFGGRGGTGGYGGYYGYGFGGKGAKKNAQPSKGADSFYSEIQGIVALFGGSDYLGDADEEVRSGYYGGKGGYGFYEEVDSLFGGNIGAAAGGYGGVFYGGKGAKKNAQPSKGADSFYSEIQGIVALFGGRDYLGDADEEVGYFGTKGGKGSKGGYGRR